MEKDGKELFYKQTAERVSELVADLAKNPNDFAAKTGIKQPTIFKAMKTGKGVSKNFIDSITKRYNQVNPIWLFFGTGPKFLETQESNESMVKEPDYSYSKEPSLFVQTARELEKMREEIARLKRRVEALENPPKKP